MTVIEATALVADPARGGARARVAEIGTTTGRREVRAGAVRESVR